MPVDSGALLLDDRPDRLAGLRGRARRRARGAGDRASSSTTPSSATASRSSRPRTRPRCGGRRAAPRARDDPRRRRAARARRVARAEAVARRRRQRLPRALLAVGRRRRNRFYDAAAPRLSAEARAFLAGVLDHLPGLCGLTAPSFNSYRRIAPQYWAGRVRLLGLRQPRGAAAGPVRLPRSRGGVDERRAQGRRRELQPVSRARRADRRGPRRARARARAARAGRGRPGHARRGGARRARDRPPAGDPGARRSTRSRPTPFSLDALGAVLAASYLAVRRSEWAAYSAEDAAFEQQGHFSKY